MPHLTLNVHNPPSVWLLAKVEWLFPLFSVVCSFVSSSLLIVRSWSGCQPCYPEFSLRVETVSRLLGSISKQKRGVADKLQAPALESSLSTQLTSLFLFPASLFLPFIPQLTSDYLTAKTNCLTVEIHNSSYTLLKYKSTVLFLHANMEKVCKPCDTSLG